MMNVSTVTMVSFFIQHSFVFCNRLLTHIMFIELSEFPVREHLASTLFVSWSLLSFLGFFVFFRLWRLYFSLTVVIIIIIINKSLVLSLVPCYFCFISRSLVFIFIQPKTLCVWFISRPMKPSTTSTRWPRTACYHFSMQELNKLTRSLSCLSK